MRKEEKELIKSLCNFRRDSIPRGLLRYATPEVLGCIFMNRMQGIAYGTLKNRGMLGRVNREFRNSLKSGWEGNRDKNRSFFHCVEELIEVLSHSDCSYAMLKGAVLCALYPEGYRTANDIDLLVEPKDVDKIGDCLCAAGFRQGSVRGGEFVPATRREIIGSRMLRGETVPYVKKVMLPGMDYLEVDLNFSLDYKNSPTDVLRDFLSRTQLWDLGKYKVPTLEKTDFLIHLCAHLYKEAAALPWVEMARDMTLYKYCDLYLLCRDLSAADAEELFRRAKTLGMEKICAFAFLQTAALFDLDQPLLSERAEEILRDDPDFLHRVISPRDRKSYLYTQRDVEKRFFSHRRKSLLKEEKK